MGGALCCCLIGQSWVLWLSAQLRYLSSGFENCGWSCAFFQSSLQFSCFSTVPLSLSCLSSCCCLFWFFKGHFVGMWPLVLHLEKYGGSGQSFFRCPHCLHQKHTLSVVELHFTLWPSADLGILGSWVWGIGFYCDSAAGMKDCAEGLKFYIKGNEYLCCLICWPWGPTLGCMNGSWPCWCAACDAGAGGCNSSCCCWCTTGDCWNDWGAGAEGCNDATFCGGVLCEGMANCWLGTAVCCGDVTLLLGVFWKWFDIPLWLCCQCVVLAPCGVHCSHGSKLSVDGLFCCDEPWLVDTVPDAGAAESIGLKVGEGLCGTKPDVVGTGESQIGYIPLLQTCLSQMSASVVIPHMTCCMSDRPANVGPHHI